MLMPFHILPVEEAQPFDDLSDRDFFAQFPAATHRTRLWAPCLARDEGWVIVSRRDGLSMRMRQHMEPFARAEIVILSYPPADSDLSFDYGPSFNIVGAARHAR